MCHCTSSTKEMIGQFAALTFQLVDCGLKILSPAQCPSTELMQPNVQDGQRRYHHFHQSPRGETNTIEQHLRIPSGDLPKPASG